MFLLFMFFFFLSYNNNLPIPVNPKNYKITHLNLSGEDTGTRYFVYESISHTSPSPEERVFVSMRRIAQDVLESNVVRKDRSNLLE